MGDTRAQRLDHASGFDTSDDRLRDSTAFVGAIAAHPDVTKIHPTDFNLYAHLAWPGGRIGDFEYTQYFRGTSLRKGYSLHGSLLGLLFPLHEAPAVYGVREHEVKPNIPYGWGCRLTPAAPWGMMPGGTLQYSVAIKPRRSLCQSQERP